MIHQCVCVCVCVCQTSYCDLVVSASCLPHPQQSRLLRQLLFEVRTQRVHEGTAGVATSGAAS